MSRIKAKISRMERINMFLILDILAVHPLYPLKLSVMAR